MILLQLAQRLHGERNRRVRRCARAVLLEMRNVDGKFVGFVVFKRIISIFISEKRVSDRRTLKGRCEVSLIEQLHCRQYVKCSQWRSTAPWHRRFHERRRGKAILRLSFLGMWRECILVVMW